MIDQSGGGILHWLRPADAFPLPEQPEVATVLIYADDDELFDPSGSA